MNTLLFAAALIVLIQPDSLPQLSFQLSFLAVLCLGFYSDITKKIQLKPKTKVQETDAGTGEEVPALSKVSEEYPVRLIRKSLSGAWHYLRSSSLISLAATAGTAPLVAYSFNYFLIISPLSNLVLTPFIGFVILPLSLASSFAYLISGNFPIVSFIDTSTALSLDLIKYMATWNFAAITVPSFRPCSLSASIPSC